MHFLRSVLPPSDPKAMLAERYGELVHRSDLWGLLSECRFDIGS